jgi:hypothetical protein
MAGLQRARAQGKRLGRPRSRPRLKPGSGSHRGAVSAAGGRRVGRTHAIARVTNDC